MNKSNEEQEAWIKQQILNDNGDGLGFGTGIAIAESDTAIYEDTESQFEKGGFPPSDFWI